MPEPILLLLPIIAFAAFVLKATTGFGPAIIVIALGSLIIAPREIIVTSAALDMLAGAALLKADWPKNRLGFLLPLGAAIVIGSVIGSAALAHAPPDSFKLVLAGSLFLLGLWFLFKRAQNPDDLEKTLPARTDGGSAGMTFLGGFFGGFVGISGPPIIWHFGRRFAKHAFRQTLVPIFFAAALSRTIAYGSLGLISRQVLVYVLISLPGLILGLALGNRIFFSISETTFSRIVGLMLIAAAVVQLAS